MRRRVIILYVMPVTDSERSISRDGRKRYSNGLSRWAVSISE